MKKIISLFMALIFVLTMATPSFAAVAANEAVVAQSAEVYDDGGSGDILGKVIGAIEAIWNRIVDFFKSIFNFGSSVGTYDIVYYKDETKTEVHRTVSLAEGEEINDIDIPVKKGYTFKAWMPPLPSTMPDTGIEVWATWSINTYTIKFETGVDGVNVDSIQKDYNTVVDLPDLGEVNNRVLIGWETPSGVLIEMPNGQILLNANVTLRAKWGVKRTTITFDANGGDWEENIANDGVYKIRQEVGQKVAAPANPTRAGYEFEGWDGVVPVNQPSEDVTFKAVWKALDITTTWVVNNKVVDTQVTKAGSNISPRVSASPDDGYTFVGWKLDADGVVYNKFPIATPSVAAKFTAEFRPLSFTYSFKGMNGETVSSGSALCGTDITVPDAPEKIGYTFAGWVDGDGELLQLDVTNTFAVMPAEDVVYTATYTPIEYTITWDANGGTVNGNAVDETKVAFEADIIIPTAVKTGYVFGGWTPTVPATMPNNNLAFEAIWNPAGNTNYTVETYTMGLDGKYAVASAVKTGKTDSAVILSPEAKEGFTLNETSSVLEGIIAADGSTVLKVYYDRNKYDVTIDGVTNEYYYGATVKTPAAAEKEGHTFKGWKGTDGKLYAAESDMVVPAVDDYELIAEFEVNEYTLTFNYSANGTDSTVWYTAKVAYGAEIVAPAAPSVEGMYFEGWKTADGKDLPATMPATNLTFNAIFVSNVDLLIVTFDANGGIFPDKTTTTDRTVYRGETINLPQDPSKTDKRFAGWGLTADATETVVVGTMTSDKDITYYAVYVDITCEVTYIYKDIDGTVKTYIFNEGAENESETQIYTVTEGGSAEVIPPVLDAKTGYNKVSEWSLTKVNGKDVERNEDGTIKDEKIEEFETSDADYTREYYAEYIINEHNVTFVGDDKCNWAPEEEGAEAVLAETKSVNFDEMIVAPEAPDYIEDGYVFIGWYEGNEPVLFEDTLTIYAPGSDIAKVGDEEGYSDSSEYTFAAVYDYHKFVINYTYDGEVLHTEELMFGEAIEGFTPEESQIIKGMEFTGWAPIAIPETVNLEMFKTAVWDAELNAYVFEFTAVTAPLNYNIKFINCFKETLVVPFNTEITDEIISDPDAETGYTFTGWVDADGNPYTFPEYMPANDLEVYASWEINTHTVTWVINGEETVVEYVYDAEIVKPADPEIEGYTFMGWDKNIPATMPDESLTFEAIFEINSYKLTWNLDGVITEEILEFGEAIVVSVIPSKAGYTFIGWEGYTPGMTMPANDLELKALWLIKTFTVTWIVDGAESVETYKYGADIVKPENPVKEGYEFTGWTPEVAGTIGEENLTYAANFVACEYDVTFVSGEEYGDVSVTVSVPYGELVADYAPEAFKDATNTEGKYITGWAELEEGFTMPVPAEEEEFIYTAIWGTESYVFNFVYGEAETDVISVEAEFGGEIAEFEAPAKDGYEFIGWFDAEGNEVTLPMAVENDYGENGEKVEFAAEWNALPYEAVFNANGGDFGKETDEEGNPFIKTVETIEVLCGEAIEFPETPVRKGYTFLGWNGSDGSFVAAEEIATAEVAMPADGIEYIAYWEVKTFKITYNYAGGKDTDGADSKEITIPYGSVIPVPVVERDGYIFSTWDDVLVNNQILEDESDLEFTAVWIANTDTTYTINLYVMNTEGKYDDVPTKIIKSGTTDEIGLAEAVIDFPFDASYQDIDTTKSTSHLSTTITGDNKAIINVYVSRKQFAVYTEVEGETEKVTDYYYGAIIPEPVKPVETREHYNFKWVNYTAGMTMPAEDVTIKGEWIAEAFKITVASLGANKTAVYEIPFGENPAEYISNPSRDGYKFLGWDTPLPETMPAEDFTITALWEKVTEEA